MPEIQFRENAIFNGVTFPAHVLFTGATFNGHVFFEGANFFGIALFDKGTTFIRDAVFTGAKFRADDRMSGDLYIGNEVFSNARFTSALFVGARFRGIAAFNGAAFINGVSFEGAEFSGDAKFEDNASFGYYAVFNGATFGGEARFSGATFGGAASFDDRTTFICDALFNGVKFGGEALFNRAEFSGEARFSGATFGGEARFSGAKFSGDAKFDGATFGGDAAFPGATFRAVADFSAREPGDNDQNKFLPMNFECTKFTGLARFTNRRFLDTTNFRHAEFRRNAPQFHHCELHQDTDFTGAIFCDRSAQATRAYRTLKLAMEETRARNDQATFFALEQECLQNDLNTPWNVRLVSRLYFATANYGQSLLRPLAWFFVVLVIFFAVYWILFTLAVASGVLFPDFLLVVRFTLRQVFRPFYALGADTVPLGRAFFGAIHSLLNFVFLTLFVLAVRRRFIMR